MNMNMNRRGFILAAPAVILSTGLLMPWKQPFFDFSYGALRPSGKTIFRITNLDEAKNGVLTIKSIDALIPIDRYPQYQYKILSVHVRADTQRGLRIGDLITLN